MKKYGITYDNTRNHDKRQISLTLDLPEKEQKKSDDLKADESVLHEEFVSKNSELGHSSGDEVGQTYGQVYRERLVMFEPEKEDSEDEYIPRSVKVNDYHSTQIHHKPRTMQDENFQEESFSFRMQDKL